MEQYLRTSYDPDVEYVDGVLVERNVGEWLHSLVQANIIVALRRAHPDLYALPSVRWRTQSTRCRLPDVCATLAVPDTRYLVEPPLVTIEILSEDDRMSQIMEKLQEYAAAGTANIWLFDPKHNLMFTFQANSLQEVTGDVIATGDPRLELTREEVFQHC